MCYTGVASIVDVDYLSIFVFHQSAEGEKWEKQIAVKSIKFRKEGEQLENYTKYKLKERDELVSLLADKDNLFVIACNKCFKEFETIDEPDCGEFEKLASTREKLRW